MELPKLPEPVRMSSDQAYLGYTSDQMRAYAEEAVRLEREACAQACEDRAGTMSMFGSVSDARTHNATVRGCAAAIRARSEAPT